MNQLEMLVNHSDSEIKGIVGAVYMDFLAPHLYHTPVRMIETEENTHESTFSSTVLSEYRVNLALFHLQGYIIICYYSGEFLANSDHLDYVTHYFS